MRHSYQLEHGRTAVAMHAYSLLFMPVVLIIAYLTHVTASVLAVWLAWLYISNKATLLDSSCCKVTS